MGVIQQSVNQGISMISLLASQTAGFQARQERLQARKDYKNAAKPSFEDTMYDTINQYTQEQANEIDAGFMTQDRKDYLEGDITHTQGLVGRIADREKQRYELAEKAGLKDEAEKHWWTGINLDQTKISMELMKKHLDRISPADIGVEKAVQREKEIRQKETMKSVKEISRRQKMRQHPAQGGK